MINLLDFNQAQLAEYFVGLGEKPFRAKQLMRWIHHFGVNDVEQMTDIAKSLREKLAATTTITPPNVQLEQISNDGTRKWLVGAGSGNGVETVFIPEDDRGTLCISSQVAVPLNVRFVQQAAKDLIVISACLRLLVSYGWPIIRLDKTQITVCCRLVSALSAMW